MRISSHVQAIINAAYNEARGRNHEYLTPEHILYAALAFDDVQGILSSCGADTAKIKNGMEKYFEESIPVVQPQTEPIQTVGFQNVIERAALNTQSSQKGVVEIADILVSLFDEERNQSAYELRKAGIKRLDLLNVLSHGYTGESGGKFGPFEDAALETEPGHRPKGSGKRNLMERFVTDLTAMAKDGRLEQFIGR
ncbi:MAG: ATP-dependent Clp protease ATP-binding subunit ClpA, partial [Treponema sp.]|nr:ATP-dependent Clp protease ATP-binding subunit ClpA [Treponema sp.]